MGSTGGHDAGADSGHCREFPGFALPDAPVWRVAAGAHMTDTCGRTVLDLAMGFGTALYGHGVVPRTVMAQYELGNRDAGDTGDRLADSDSSTGTIPAGGLGDLMRNASRVRATRLLTSWAASRWGSHGVPAYELRALVLHTGSEAVETALKTALLATGRSRIVAFTNAYHGTFGLALATTHRAEFRAPFAAQYATDAVRFEPFGVVPELTTADACVIVEPVQGRAGIIVPPAGFLHELREACTQVGALLILDDVLVGCGRTGAALEGAHVAPDMICLGKALGGGLAASAVLATRAVAERAWGSSNPAATVAGGEIVHTSTLVGDALASAAVCATLEHYDQAAIDEHGAAWLTALREAADHARWTLRGRGLMWALDSGRAGEGFATFRALLDVHNIVTIPSGSDGSSLTFLPSLACTDADRARTVRALVELLGLMA
ncbi:MAG: aminotransferase class III-fold pyridoxal phosphate-dependent enzyme [Thermoleophilia bacterium]|nr:aminotransferase class III-fold pyridoxal phosphate-dependent enzyme [Thermoleophilia bacterium]